MVRMALERKKCLRTRGPFLSSPGQIVAFVIEHYGCEPQEVVRALALTPRSEVVHVQEIGTGGFSHAMVDPRVVFAGAILSGATAIVLVHNHPSGDLTPSTHDVALTRQLVDGGRLLGIRVLDHIGVSPDGTYYSMQAKGGMPDSSDDLTGLGDEEQAPYEEER